MTTMDERVKRVAEILSGYLTDGGKAWLKVAIKADDSALAKELKDMSVGASGVSLDLEIMTKEKKRLAEENDRLMEVLGQIRDTASSARVHLDLKDKPHD